MWISAIIGKDEKSLFSFLANVGDETGYAFFLFFVPFPGMRGKKKKFGRVCCAIVVVSIFDAIIVKGRSRLAAQVSD